MTQELARFNFELQPMFPPNICMQLTRRFLRFGGIP
jgi:hypothetical protein